MGFRKKIQIKWLLIALTALPVTALSLEQRPIKVCWESGLKPPYLMQDKEDKPTGIAVDMLNAILHKQSRPVSNLLRPWKRCLADIKAGRVDIVPNSSYQEQRAEYALYTHPLYKTHLVLYYRLQDYSQEPIIASLDDLSNYTVGGILGFNYSFYNNQIPLDTGANNRQSLMSMLRSGRFDFALVQKEVIQMLAKSNEVQLAGLANIPDPVKPEQAFHLLVSKKSFKAKTLQKFLNQEIENQYANGMAGTIINQYLGSQH